MKKFFTGALGWSAVFATLFIASCGKDNNLPKPPDPTPTKQNPTLTVSEPAKALYGQAVSIPFSTAYAKVVLVGNQQQAAVSGSYGPVTVTADTQLTFVAQGEEGTTPATKTVSISVFTQNETRLICTGSAKWVATNQWALFPGATTWADGTASMPCQAPMVFNQNYLVTKQTTACGSPQDSWNNPWVLTADSIQISNKVQAISFVSETIMDLTSRPSDCCGTLTGTLTKTRWVKQ